MQVLKIIKKIMYNSKKRNIFCLVFTSFGCPITYTATLIRYYFNQATGLIKRDHCLERVHCIGIATQYSIFLLSITFRKKTTCLEYLMLADIIFVVFSKEFWQLLSINSTTQNLNDLVLLAQ
jgi:hypothetical protein